MNKLKSICLSYKCLVKLIAFSLFFLLFYSIVPVHIPGRNVSDMESTNSFEGRNRTILPLRQNAISSISSFSPSSSSVHLWCTVVRIGDSNSMMTRKFKVFIKSLAQYLNRSLSLNVLTDRKSRPFVSRVISAATVKAGGVKNESAFHQVSHEMGSVCMPWGVALNGSKLN